MFSVHSMLSNSSMPEKAEVIPVVDLVDATEVEIIEKPSDKKARGVWQKEKLKSGITKSSKNVQNAREKWEIWTLQEKKDLRPFIAGRELTVEDCKKLFASRSFSTVKGQIYAERHRDPKLKKSSFWNNRNSIQKAYLEKNVASGPVENPNQALINKNKMKIDFLLTEN